MNDLPRGWVAARTGDVLHVAYGKTLDKTRRVPGTRFRYVGSGGPIADSPDRLTTRDTIVVGRKGTAGSVQRFIDGCWPSDTTFYMELPDALNGALLEHQLRSAQLGQHDRSTALPGLGRPDLEATRLVIPPVPEQARIVTAIEEAFSKLDAGEAGLRRVSQLLRRMREAVLLTAVTGHLVPQDPSETSARDLLVGLGIRSEPSTVSDGWSAVAVGDLGLVGTGTTPSRRRVDYWAGGDIPWVTSALLGGGAVLETREFVTSTALAETSLRVWPCGTLMVAMYGEGRTRGRCSELHIAAACNQACAAILVRDELAAYREFVRVFFDANYESHRRLASGGVQPNLNVGLIKSISVHLPPIREARRIVSEVERQFSFIVACERAVEAGLARSAALRRSVLKSAFEGRLVTQDPSDEPASVLLDRIRSARAQSARVGSPPKSAKPRRRGAS